MSARQALIEHSPTDIVGGNVVLTMATRSEAIGLDRVEYEMRPTEAIELGQRLISVGVRAIRDIAAGPRRTF